MAAVVERIFEESGVGDVVVNSRILNVFKKKISVLQTAFRRERKAGGKSLAKLLNGWKTGISGPSTVRDQIMKITPLICSFAKTFVVNFDPFLLFFDLANFSFIQLVVLSRFIFILSYILVNNPRPAILNGNLAMLL